MKAQYLLENLISYVEESIQGIKLIYANLQTTQREKAFTQLNEAHKKTSDRVLWRRDLASPVSEFLGILIVVALLWIGSNFVFDARISPELFFAFVFAFYQLIEPSKNFSNAYYSLKKGAVGGFFNTFLHPVTSHKILQ